MKKRDIIKLIQYHYDKDEIQFRATANDIARSFDENGDHQLAEYVMSFLSDVNTFVPQSVTFESQFVNAVDVGTSSLPLPTLIAEDIKGIINAVNHRVGINKFLFEGEPGTGKTESAKQVARLLNRSLYLVDFNQLIDSKMGQTAKNIAIVFNEINRMPNPSNAVILFDEIDAIALDRVNNNDIREMGRATSSMLKALDNVNSDVVIIATTNLYNKLDRAFRRRFDTVISFDRYSKSDLLEVAEVLLTNDLKSFKEAGRDTKLFRKILDTAKKLPNPGELKNIIKVALAFSDPSKPFDYLIRIYKDTHQVDQISMVDLKDEGFTVREIGVLTGTSKSQVARELRGTENE
ncbi:AAA family ATPase [Lactobacillus sp. LC28-10]|uniref:AAA family ATPase n=1 Tax=Secundilactobacillus angelensis TaxID=2722706 RepID=A0ABX1KU77_9LACO|nr:ATP-binding protein [Secundilactobacillus angelensis]MCH5461316.1 ATP-binding protein [Secundilactobacillus angelensis]NLR17488.1 AAA family ATPase [Secundilactobacillus angelensis]